MAKFKFEAGATFDTITQKEMEETLRKLPSWMAEQAQGIRYTRFYSNAAVAGNAVDFGSQASVGQVIGPAPGFIWDIRRLRLSGTNAADSLSIYVNDANPSSLVCTTGDITNRLFLFSEQVILYPGDALRIVGTGLNASTVQVTASGQAREIPMTLAWRIGS